MRFRLVQLTEPGLDLTQEKLGLSVDRTQVNSGAELLQRLVHLLLGKVDLAQLQIRTNELGILLLRLLITGNRAVGIALQRFEVAQPGDG